jgi:hypothetical protein
MSDKLFYKVAQLSIGAGVMPQPIDDDVIQIIKLLIDEEQAKFAVKTFKIKTWMSFDEIRMKNEELEQENITNMFRGEADSTSLYMSGELTIEGNLQDAMAFGEVLGLMQEELQG